MGELAETVAVGVGWKDTQFRSSQTHNVSCRQKEDRGGCTCTLEEVQSGEEGGVKYFTRITRYFGGGLFL
jgi:hypothetical protein